MRGDFLDRIDGKLFIRNEDTEHDRPIRRRLWWPILATGGWPPCWFDTESSGEYCRTCGQRKDSPIHDLSGDTLRLGGRDGSYGGTLRNGTRYTVTIDPRGQAVKIEDEPIVCPKVRAGIETRFYRGNWQKYLKSSGWVDVY
jgi:hypothetical protein